MNAPRSLGLFGGSFNPVHRGHLELALSARAALKLDEVWLIPCARSADRKALAPGALRLRWLKMALRGHPGLKASDVELKRDGLSRSIDTLRQLREQLGPGPRFTLLLGLDQALRLHGWKDADQLPSLCRLAVFRRPGSEGRPDKFFHAVDVPAPLMEISSSNIRSRLRSGKSLDGLLPGALLRDVALRRAYGGTAATGPKRRA